MGYCFSHSKKSGRFFSIMANSGNNNNNVTKVKLTNNINAMQSNDDNRYLQLCLIFKVRPPI